MAGRRRSDDWDRGRAVLKLYRPGFGRHGAEAAALTLLDGTGVAPRLLERVQVEGRDGLVLQRLDGMDMLAVLQRRPWRLAALARVLARTARRIHQLKAPPELPDVVGVLGDRIAAAELPGDLRGFANRTLAGLPAGDQLCHGDLHPGNAIVTGDQARVIDWPAATRGTPTADVARTLLLLRQSDPVARHTVARARRHRGWAVVVRRGVPPLLPHGLTGAVAGPRRLDDRARGGPPVGGPAVRTTPLAAHRRSRVPRHTALTRRDRLESNVDMMEKAGRCWPRAPRRPRTSHVVIRTATG